MAFKITRFDEKGKVKKVDYFFSLNTVIFVAFGEKDFEFMKEEVYGYMNECASYSSGISYMRDGTIEYTEGCFIIELTEDV
jgi:hypothetical protein